MNEQLIKYLEETKKIIENFIKISKKYPLGHIYYKKNLQKIQLELSGYLKRIRNLKLIKTFKMDILINSFIKTASINLSTADCEKFINKINYIIQDLKLELEQKQEFIERIYDKNCPFDFYNDLKEIIDKTKKDLFIIEPFVNEHLLEITLKDLNKKIYLKILTNSRNADRRGKFDKLANMFKIQQIGGFEVRETEDIHDRAIFIEDNEGWVIGQSIKDAGKKPTYLIKLKNQQKLKDIYDKIWNLATKMK